MRQKEQRMYDSFKEAKPPGVWIQRVENRVGDGIPDVLVMHPEGGTNWLEFKAPNEPKRESTNLMGDKQGLRTSQKNWHVKCARMLQRSYVLIRSEPSRRIYLIQGVYADDVNSFTACECARFCDLRIATDKLAPGWSDLYEYLAKR